MSLPVSVNPTRAASHLLEHAPGLRQRRAVCWFFARSGESLLRALAAELPAASPTTFNHFELPVHLVSQSVSDAQDALRQAMRLMLRLEELERASEAGTGAPL